MKSIFSLLICIILVTIPLNLLANNDIDKILHEKCIYPSIFISGPKNNGSGVITRSIKIDENTFLNFFLSCNHVAFNANCVKYEVTVYEYENWSNVKSQKTYRCLYHALDCENDLAIGAFISERKMPTADVDLQTDLYIGNKITTVASGLSDYPRTEFGNITSTTEKNVGLGNSKIKFSSHIMPGDSGGPVYKDNKLIGTIQSIVGYRGQLVFGTAYFTPIKAYDKWNKENQKNYEFSWTCDEDFPKLVYNKLKFLRDMEIYK